MSAKSDGLHFAVYGFAPGENEGRFVGFLTDQQTEGFIERGELPAIDMEWDALFHVIRDDTGDPVAMLPVDVGQRIRPKREWKWWRKVPAERLGG